MRNMLPAWSSFPGRFFAVHSTSFFRWRWDPCLCLTRISVTFSLLILYICGLTSALEGTLNIDGIFFQIERPEKLSYLYQINPSFHIGGQLPEKTLENIGMVYAEPEDGCQDFTNSKVVKDEIVLIERGDCPFVDKVLNAEKAGAKMAIITDSAAGTDDFIDMISDDGDRRSEIPAAYLPGVSGRRIREYLLYEKPIVWIDIPLNYTSRPLEAYNKPPWELW